MASFPESMGPTSPAFSFEHFVQQKERAGHAMREQIMRFIGSLVAFSWHEHPAFLGSGNAGHVFKFATQGKTYALKTPGVTHKAIESFCKK